MASATSLRVGIVHYLNAWPLAWGFLDGGPPAGWETVYLSPAAVADGLADGSLDVGLLPSAELQRIPGLVVLPELCIAARHEVRSVLLVSKVEPAAIRRVALDRSSRTSSILVRLLLAERWGARPEVESAAPDLAAMLAGADAALLIGDPALAVDRERFLAIDLAAEWRALTGLPFVFAVWAARQGAASEEMAAVFRRSLAHGLADIEAIVELASAELGLAAAVARRYLTESLSYRLGNEEAASLDEFFTRAHRHGLLPAPRPVRIGDWRLEIGAPL